MSAKHNHNLARLFGTRLAPVGDQLTALRGRGDGYFRTVGAQGGKIGGARRAAALTPERRQEIARMGGLAKRKKPLPE